MRDVGMAISALTGAVDVLTTESGTIGDRLLLAAEFVDSLQPGNFPEEIEDEYSRILADAQQLATDDAAGAGDEEQPSSFGATVPRLDEDEASEFAERLVSLYVCLRVYLVRTRLGEKIDPS